MWYSIDIYRRLISVNIRGQLQYRVSFLFDFLATALITVLAFGSVALILQRFNNIGGWTVFEIAFLFGMAETAFGTMDMIFSGFDPPYFGQRVRIGSFDQMLLRPVNLIAQIFGSQFILRRLGRIIQGSIILLIALTQLDIQWTAIKITMIPIVFVSLVIFFGGLFIIGATLSFWTIESLEVVNLFTYGGTEMIQYPMLPRVIYTRQTRSFRNACYCTIPGAVCSHGSFYACHRDLELRFTFLPKYRFIDIRDTRANASNYHRRGS
jgi:ABC-2 type transport system permease protein